MLTAFIESWPLFQNSYLAALLSAITLSWLGLILVGRNQVFLSLVATQAASCALALGSLVGVMLDQDWNLYLLSIGSSLLVSVPALVRPARTTTDPGLLGWLFAGLTSGSLLLLAQSPLGLEQMQQLLGSSLIGAQPQDLLWLGLNLLMLLVLILRYRQHGWLLILDPAMAQANGLPIRRLGWVLALLLGLGIGLSIRIAGSLYVFGLLLLPVLIARQLGSTLNALLWLSPAIALASGLLGLILANHYDYPPGQLCVALLSLLLLLIRLPSWLSRR